MYEVQTGKAHRSVLFINPPSGQVMREDRCQIPFGNPVMSPDLPPTDLLTLAAVAEREGLSCAVRDYSRSGSVDTLLDDLRHMRPDFLVIAVAFPTLEADLLICGAAKGTLPNLHIIAKGAPALTLDTAMLENCANLDTVIRGEPELTFRDILQGRGLDQIAGITWRGPQGIRRNPERPFNDDLDSLPFPARHLIDNSVFVTPDTGRPQAVIRVSRGCPYRCFYCLATPLAGSKVRMRSPANIVAEVRECVERYGIRDFLFWSDVFNADRDWVLALCQEVEGSGLGIRWSANSRADRVDMEQAGAMRRSGCRLISLGIESGSQEMLDRMGKGLRLEDARNAARILRTAGIRTVAYYLFGLPWETRQTANETGRFSRELGTDFASFLIASPLPGTGFHAYAKRHGLFVRDPMSGFERSHYAPIVRGHALGTADIERYWRSGWKRFYFRLRFVYNWMQSMPTAVEVIRACRGVFALLLNGMRTPGRT